ncbi:unnamed protein product [Pedinophyceae sp. YPF-701]|nr:unnamed protein product [Pedinophyceae sp. YPF-701]
MLAGTPQRTSGAWDGQREEEWHDCTEHFPWETTPARPALEVSIPDDAPPPELFRFTSPRGWSDAGQGAFEGDATDRFPGHAAALEGDLLSLATWLDATPREQWTQVDSQGFTVLHLAAVGRRRQCLGLLLQRGFPVSARCARGWTAMDEAVALEDRDITKMLYRAWVTSALTKLDEIRPKLVEALRNLPDFRLQLSWDLGSPIFGLILRKVAPSDTYTIYKSGHYIRIDGNLRGIDKRSSGIIPRWKRGPFSVLLSAGESETRPKVLVCDHLKRRVLPLAEQAREGDLDVEADVDEIMREGPTRVRIAAEGVALRPSRTLFGLEALDMVDGWECTLMDMTCQLVGKEITKAANTAARDVTYNELAELELPEDDVKDHVLDPLSRDKATKDAPRKRRVRTFKSKWWMADGFPLKVEQLLPILDLFGSGNPAFERVSAFIRGSVRGGLFPLRVQIPLILTVHATMAFSGFAPVAPGEYSEDFFLPPPDYTQLSIEDVHVMFEKTLARYGDQTAHAAGGAPAQAEQDTLLSVESESVAHSLPPSSRAASARQSTRSAIAPHRHMSGRLDVEAAGPADSPASDWRGPVTPLGRSRHRPGQPSLGGLSVERFADNMKKTLEGAVRVGATSASKPAEGRAGGSQRLSRASTGVPGEPRAEHHSWRGRIGEEEENADE